MNEKQQEWTKDKCNRLKQYLEQENPASDEQWDSVVDYIEKIVKLAKGNTEVRSALFDVIDSYQKRKG